MSNRNDELNSWFDASSTKSLSPLVSTQAVSNIPEVSNMPEPEVSHMPARDFEIDMFNFENPLLDYDARAINNIFNPPAARPSIPTPSPSTPSSMFHSSEQSSRAAVPSEQSSRAAVPSEQSSRAVESEILNNTASVFNPSSFDSAALADSSALSAALDSAALAAVADSNGDATVADTNELLRNLKMRMANLNQTELNEKLEEINTNIERIISEGGSHSEIMGQLKLLESGTNLLVKRSEQKNKIKSHLSRYYANLCAVGTYLNPDVNRVIATIEAGASLALITNQVLPFMRPFSSATPFLSTLAVGALVADMGIRRHTSGGSLRSVVEPLIEKVVPLCSVVASNVAAGVCNTFGNTRTGRYIGRKGRQTARKFRKGIEKAKQLGRDISEGTSSLASSAASWADRTGRRTLRAVFDPVNTINNAIHFCKDTLHSLSESQSRVVIPKDSSSSVSSNSSIASDIREELLENNPFIMSKREVLDEIQSMAREDKYSNKSFNSSSSSVSLLGNKRKGNSSDDTRKKRRRYGGVKSLKN